MDLKKLLEDEKLPQFKTYSLKSFPDIPAVCSSSEYPLNPNQMYFKLPGQLAFPTPSFLDTSGSLTRTHFSIPCRAEQLRLPLPPTRFEEEPRYVNAKQYVRIMKMREKRQKRPQRTRTIRKYMHESRHQHTIKRQRCKNGRFVSKSNTSHKQHQPLDELSQHDDSSSLDKLEIRKSNYL